ncbi:MAG TPA: hypothetical protein VFV67_34010 [Actinophytocola sp.]|uniref:hypothetical protein n=1 Tax=Actinophytocola sp. TaxID=1872138 RepID=UPI002DB66D4A|nr:hypothetical protein [Actinophytocola sp.]HEU5475683.1 hypothetical protein [Actinophytocola sp.]
MASFVDSITTEQAGPDPCPRCHRDSAVHLFAARLGSVLLHVLVVCVFCDRDDVIEGRYLP